MNLTCQQRSRRSNRTAFSKNHLRVQRTLLTIAVSILHFVPAQGTTTWTNAGIVKNFWDFADNWSAGIPDGADIVTFPNPFPGTGTITLLSSQSADSLDFNDGGYTLTGGTLTLTSGNISVDSSGDTVTFETPLFGTAGLTKTGAGHLNLQSASNYSGNTTVSQGFLDLSDASQLIPTLSEVSISSGAELRFFSGTATETIGSLAGAGKIVFGNIDAGGTDLRVGANNSSTTFSGNISDNFGGSGKLTKIGSGVLTLSGTNSYLGGTVVSDGTLQVSSSNLPVGFGVENNSLLTFNQNFSGTFSGGISGNGAVTKAGSGTLTLSGTNSYSAGTILSGGTLSISNDDNLGADSGTVFFDGGTLNVSGGSPVNFPGARHFQVESGSDAELNVSSGTSVNLYGGISGDGGLVKEGTGVLRLRSDALSHTPSTYSGPTTINAGFLRVRRDDSVPGITDLIPDQSDVTVAFNAGFGVFGLTDFGFPFGYTETIGSLSGSGVVVFDGSSGNHLRVGANNSSTTFAGNIIEIIGLGSGKLTKIGTGTLALTGNNAYSEGTEISAGALEVDTDSLPAAGGVVNNSLLTFNQGSNSTYAGVISGSGAVAKTGSGTLTLDQVNTYTNSTLLTEGTLAISDDDNLGADTAPVFFDGGTLRATGASGYSLAPDRSLVSVNGADVVVETQVSGALGVRGAISGAGGLVINSNQGNSVILSNSASNYAGNTTVNAGAALLASKQDGNDEVLPNTTDVTLNGLDAQLWLVLGITETIDGLNGSANTRVDFFSSSNNHLILGADNGNGIFEGRIFSQNTLHDGRLTKIGTGNQVLTGNNNYTGGTTVSGGTLTINTNSLPSAGGVVNNNSLVFGQDFDGTYTGVIGGTGAVTKSGAGVLALTGDNTYPGGTTVVAGTLLANNVLGGSSTGSGQVTVGFGGTFGGNGVSSGTAVIQVGGTLAPGASVGRLLVGAVQFNTGSTLEIEISGDGGAPGVDFDQLIVFGSATLGGSLTIDLVDSFLPSHSDTFEILDSATLSGVFGNVLDGGRLDTSGGEGSFLVSYNSTSNSVVLSEFLVPVNGDYDGDNDVDGIDFLFWQRGESPNPLTANDLAVWETNYGMTFPLAGATTQVPEPTTLIISLLGCFVVGTTRHDRHWTITY